MVKIKKGDRVIVRTGKDKGKSGDVLRVLTDKKSKAKRVVVSGINVAKKHLRPNPQRDEKGGIIDKEMAIDISNVGLLDEATGKAGRVGFRILEDGRKVRYFKSSNEVIDR